MYVFVDDSGDPGFKFGQGSSDFLVYTACIFKTAEKVNYLAVVLETAKESIGLHKEHELKFTKTSHTRRLDFLQFIATEELETISVVLDKRELNANGSRTTQLNMLRLLLLESADEISAAKVFLDGQGSKSHLYVLRSGLRRFSNSSDANIRELKFADSSKNVLIQLADMVAGAIHKSFEGNKPQDQEYVIRLLASKGTHTIRRLFGDESR